MFEAYLQDAYYFHLKAEKIQDKGSVEDSKRYYRVSIFCALSAMEAFINFIGDSYEKAQVLNENERAFLNDKIIEVAPSKGIVVEKSRFQPLDLKIKFIIKKFHIPLNLSSNIIWTNFIEFKNFRDNLIHPRKENDELSLNDYSDKIKKGFNGILDLMNAISIKIFSQPIRKQLLDLKIE